MIKDRLPPYFKKEERLKNIKLRNMALLCKSFPILGSHLEFNIDACVSWEFLNNVVK